MSLERRLREIRNPPGRFNLHQSGGHWHTSSPFAYLLFLMIDAATRLAAVIGVLVSEPFFALARRLATTTRRQDGQGRAQGGGATGRGPRRGRRGGGHRR